MRQGIFVVGRAEAVVAVNGVVVLVFRRRNEYHIHFLRESLVEIGDVVESAVAVIFAPTVLDKPGAVAGRLEDEIRRRRGVFPADDGYGVVQQRVAIATVVGAGFLVPI